MSIYIYISELLHMICAHIVRWGNSGGYCFYQHVGWCGWIWRQGVRDLEMVGATHGQTLSSLSPCTSSLVVERYPWFVLGGRFTYDEVIISVSSANSAGILGYMFGVSLDVDTLA